MNAGLLAPQARLRSSSKAAETLAFCGCGGDSRAIGDQWQERDEAMETAQAVITRLGLQPHPEGGWYRETWRAEHGPGARAGGTAILFLLEAGQRSHWHAVDADELWLWHAGAPVALAIAEDGAGAAIRAVTLGGDTAAGYSPQALVPANRWQAAAAHDGWALVSCVVVPGFDFAGFTLAPPDWAPPGAR